MKIKVKASLLICATICTVFVLALILSAATYVASGPGPGTDPVEFASGPGPGADPVEFASGPGPGADPVEFLASGPGPGADPVEFVA